MKKFKNKEKNTKQLTKYVVAHLWLELCDCVENTTIATLKLSRRTVEESSIGMSWAAQLLVGAPWCQLLFSATEEDEADGR